MGFSAKTLKAVHKTVKGDVQIFDPDAKVEALDSGSVVINKILGVGGYPKGRITEIYGDFSSGKTTASMHAIKSCQKEKKGALFMDFEETFDALYAKSLGISLDESDLIVLQPKTLENGWQWLIDNFKNQDFVDALGLIVIDSVAAMTPAAQLEGDAASGGGIGLMARKLAEFLPWLVKIISKPQIPVILINQERLNLAKAMNKYAGGPDTLSTGGKAVQFYNTCKLHLKVKASEKEKRENPLTGVAEEMKVLNRVRVACMKNKVSFPFLQGDIIIRFGKGIDNFLALLDIAMAKGKIERGGGGYYTFKSCLNDETHRVRGKSELDSFFKDNPEEYEALEEWFANAQVSYMSDEEVEEMKASEKVEPSEGENEGLEVFSLE